jgi:hypothetical protein
MLVNTYNIVLDISEQNYLKSDISLVQNDAEVNQFSIKIFKGNTEIDYDEVDSASITFYKLDGNVVQGNLTKTETGFTYNLGTNEIAREGTVLASVQLMGADGERLTTSQFSFVVVKDLINSTAVQSTTEFAILQQLKAELEAIDVVALTNKVGAGTLNTTAQNCVEAINEVNTEIDTHALQDASLTIKGHVMLQTTVDTSETKALTPKALNNHKSQNFSEVISTTRDLSIAGTQTINSLPIKPNHIDIIATVPNTLKFSIGAVGNNGSQRCIVRTSDNLMTQLDNAISMGESAANMTLGTATINSDGTITINWVVAGSGATGVAQIRIIAFYHN